MTDEHHDGPDEAEVRELRRSADPLGEYDRRYPMPAAIPPDDGPLAAWDAKWRPIFAAAAEAAAEPASPGRAPWLEFLDTDTLAERAEQPSPPFLIDEIWPSGAYGVIGAEDKAGKTWAMLDLAVSIATGTPFLGRYATTAGPVLILYGEGGERSLYRRLDAVCRARGLTYADLRGQVRVSLRVPHLTQRAHLVEVADELEAHPAAVVLLDPFYLAAAGAKGADLYAMGGLLGELQAAVEPAALIVSTHWNKTGKGAGADRFAGVGPGAWGRVLASVEKTSSTTDTDGASVVELSWRFTGGEIPDTGFAVRRRVWADDPHDHRSPMHYEVSELEGVEVSVRAGPKLRPSAEHVLRVLGTERTTVRDLGDRLAAAGHPLKPRTIQSALEALLEAGYVDSERDTLPTMPALWWRS